MKKIFTFFSTAIFLIACAGMTGCSKNEPEPSAQAQTYHVSIQAGKSDTNQQKTPRKALGLDGNTLTASWASGERVSVRNLTKNADLGGYLAAETSGNPVIISGDLTGTINAGDELEFKFLSPDYTNQEGTIEYISSHCDYAVATIHVASVTWGSITFEESVADFENRQAVVKFILKDGDDPIATTELVVEVEGATYTITPASATSELFVALPGFTDKTIKLTATVGSDTYTFTSPSVKTFVDGKYYIITVGMSKEENAHGFSISPTQQIEFAHGNLQYKKSTNTWRIAENQYDYVGSWYKCYFVTGSYLRLIYDEYYDGIPKNPDNVDGTVYEGDIKSDNTDFENEVPRTDCWVDYFGWNTGHPDKNPLEISYINGNYAESQADFVDWGQNPIYDSKANITYDPGTWRTLTADEWDYIFCERPNAAQLFGLATLTGHPRVDSIRGVIVFPDDFEVPVGFRSAAEPGLYDYIHNQGNSYYSLVGGGKWPNTVLSNPCNKQVCPEIADTVRAVTTNSKYLFNQNVFTLAQWEQLEEAGAVFLPAVGARMEPYAQGWVRVYNIGLLAWYWSSTHQGPGYNSAYAFEASYDATNYGTPGTQAPSIHPHGASRSLCDGLPVRLVRDLQ